MDAAQRRKQDASSEAADLSLKNQELCQELSHIDLLAQQLEVDKERALQTAQQELQEAQQELQEAQVGGGGLAGDHWMGWRGW